MPQNLVQLLDQIVVMTVVALGYTLILAMGEIDLSLGGVIALVGIVMAKLMAEAGVPFELAIIAAMVLGGACGALNATLISRFNLPPFIVTLATGALFTGTLYIVSNLVPVSNLPDDFLAISRTRFGPISLPVLILIPIVIGFYLLREEIRLRAARDCAWRQPRGRSRRRNQSRAAAPQGLCHCGRLLCRGGRVSDGPLGLRADRRGVEPAPHSHHGGGRSAERPCSAAGPIWLARCSGASSSA